MALGQVMRVMVERSLAQRGLQLWVAIDRVIGGAGSTLIAKPLEFEPMQEEGAIWQRPTAVLELEVGQQLMDELWRAGLRPTEGSGSAGSMAATERHLEDMRTLVMGIMVKEGVPVPLVEPKRRA